MPKNRNVDFWQSNFINEQTFLDFYNRLVDLYINMFEWVNLPDTCDERFLELTLLCNGAALFFQDDVTGDYLSLATTFGGKMNVYNIPNDRRAYAVGNTYQWVRNAENSVIVWNNRLHMGAKQTLEQFAIRMYHIQRAIDVNVRQQKTPIVFKGSEEQIMSLKQAYNKIDLNEPVLMMDKSFNPEEMVLYQTPAPYVAGDLNELLRSTWNNAYTYIGIESEVVGKKERLVTPEVNSNLATVEANRLTKLNARKQACDEINRMFGLNLDVQFRQIVVKDGMQDYPSVLDDDDDVPIYGYNDRVGDNA